MTTDNKKINNEQGYDIWAEFYDAYPNPTVACDEATFPTFWRHHCGKKILEVGCGTGRHTKKLISLGNFVTGVDTSAGMLGEARKKIPNVNLQLIHGDFLLRTDFDCDFDVVIESLVLEHVQDLPGFFRKASAVLKTGGDLYLSEIHPARTQKGVMAHFKRPGEDRDIHLVSFARSEDDFLQAARAGGLRLRNSADVLGDERLGKLNPKWEKHKDQPLVKIWHFVK